MKTHTVTPHPKIKMKIITYNVNGIRAAIKKDFVTWLDNEKVDIVCLQETKAQPTQIPTELFKDIGFEGYFHSAEKKGYSGVGILSKVEPTHIEYGMGNPKYDKEGRVMRADYKDVSIISAYFPSGSSGAERQVYKIDFLKDFYQYIKKLQKTHKNLIITGDYNICHRAIDIHDPIRNKNHTGFLPEEREWMDELFALGYTDTFRHFHPEAADRYSWWTYRAGARPNNKGWRIDYIAASNTLKDRLIEGDMWSEAYHSDHCPVYLKINV